MAEIEGEILIGRSVEEVFDLVADKRNEPQYNPRMVHAAKVTDGPVGKGTVFRSATRSMGRTAEMRIELTGYDRPAKLASRTIMRQADMDGRSPSSLLGSARGCAGRGTYSPRAPPG
jgi:Polyketide cyclase / dehydrase and lipid transport